MTQSVRAAIIERRTYQRPLNNNGTVFETSSQAWDRVISHQNWLWSRQLQRELVENEKSELAELRQLFSDHKVTVSGRTRWLGGTMIAKTREASQFNCSFGEIQTIHDVVDSIWLLLQGCGTGFKANIGVLNGFRKSIKELEIIRSKKVLIEGITDPTLKGDPKNFEDFDKATGVWTIRVGDSAEAWAKFFGKLMAGKFSARKLVVDFSEIRPAGYRLSGYGWISSGDTQIAKAVEGIFKILNASAGELLTAMDILDIENHLGTILSSRRSAEICLYDADGTEWKEFATAKLDHFLSEDTSHRAMSNNSLVFNKKPTKSKLKEIFRLIEKSGGSEPGFINGEAARLRAPYFKGVNPCAEILLGDKSFCNLVETFLSRFNGDWEGLLRAHYLVARANYRQTCVNLDDGILQRTWHELNQFLRLCGVGVTSVVGWEFEKDLQRWEDLKAAAISGANSMADELDLPRPQLITTVKPSGTQTKSFGHVGDELGEGAHKPLGRYILNNVNFSASDPLVKKLMDANYKVMPNPYDTTGRIVTFPVEYSNMDFDKVTKNLNGQEVEVEVNLETAIDQLGRYKMLMDHYVQHNCSITISYDLSEVPEIINWLFKNWDSYVGVSFIYRNDPSKTAADLGYPYLPQEVVDKETFEAYSSTLLPVNLDDFDNGDLVQIDDCEGGSCPIR